MNKITIKQIIYLLTAIFVLCIQPLTADAQNKVTVSIREQDVPLKKLISEIERQTRYLFLYTDDIDVERIMSVTAENETLDTVLDRMFRNTDIEYKITVSNIVLSKKEVTRKPLTVSGTVRDTDGEPLFGVAVVIDGTMVGTTTDFEGRYSIAIPDGMTAPDLRFTFLGFEDNAVAVAGRERIDVELRPASLQVDAVVVTALGITRAEKALSYNVQQVNSDAITANKDANFLNALNGKVAGLNINASSAGVGGATKVIMRGHKSISQSSNALYVIDGVPVFTKARAAGTEFDSQGTTDPMADINPEDIESISVLTGASAAALYGSDAANGAIVITTRKGNAEKLSVTFTSAVELMSPMFLPHFQNRYGTGDLSSSIGSDELSWGKKLNGSNNPGYDPADDYFKTGVTTTESVSVSMGREGNQTYLSSSAINSDGIVPNNSYDRYNFNFRNTTSFLNDRCVLDVNFSYILQRDRNMVNQGTYNNPLVGAYLFPRGNDWDQVKLYERYDTFRKLYTQYWPIGDAGITMQNPYWVNYRTLRENRKNRYMAGAALSCEILDWLSVSGRIRMDSSMNEYTEKFYATTNKQLTEQSDNGLYGVAQTNDLQVYGDALLNINKRFGEDFSLQANIGASFSDIRSTVLRTRGPIPDGVTTDEAAGLANVFNVQNLSNTSKTARMQEGWREQTQSVFGSAEIGYKGAYYLTLTGRNDWASQLAGPHSRNRSFFYPSVGLSLVVSQIIGNMPENLSYLKFRSSFASVGVAFSRYIANPLYGWNSSSLSWNTKTQYPVYNLRPERTNSFEAGMTMNFLKDFTLDLTYYHSNTMDQTFNPQISSGSGSSDIIIQSGNVLNQGFELALGYSKEWKKFSWDSDFTMSANRNRIISLADNVENPETGEIFSVDLLDMGGLGHAHFILKEGGSLGDLYSLTDLKYDSNRSIYINEEGKIPTEKITDVDKYIKLGSVLPDANMAWRNEFRFYGVSIGMMVSARLGGIVYSRTQAMLDYYGVSEASAASRDAGGIMVNGTDLIPARTWYEAVAGGNSVPQFYTYSATNVRLQEVSVGYTIPRKKLGNICSIDIAVIGRNLLMIYNRAPFDPESVATTGNYYQGIDYFMMPSLRNVGFNLKLKF